VEEIRRLRGQTLSDRGVVGEGPEFDYEGVGAEMSVATEWFTLNPEFLREDVFRDSWVAVRITHLPTGIEAICSEGTQTYNRAQALEELTGRVFHALVDVLNADLNG
jgi:hypothetical protein